MKAIQYLLIELATVQRQNKKKKEKSRQPPSLKAFSVFPSIEKLIHFELGSFRARC